VSEALFGEDSETLGSVTMQSIRSASLRLAIADGATNGWIFSKFQDASDHFSPPGLIGDLTGDPIKQAYNIKKKYGVEVGLSIQLSSVSESTKARSVNFGLCGPTSNQVLRKDYPILAFNSWREIVSSQALDLLRRHALGKPLETDWQKDLSAIRIARRS
jgi:hypothetical protein